MGIHDTPFVELDSPPRSTTQTPEEQDVHGNDYEALDDEHAKAVAYRDAKVAQSEAHKNVILAPLAGNKDAFRALQHKLFPLTNVAPPYLDSP